MNNITVKCPCCGKDVIWDKQATERPFCSKRCRVNDLGAWASEQYTVPSAPVNQQNLEE